MDTRRRQKGFSLIEIIVIVVIAGFLGALLVNMLGTQMFRGSTPTASASKAATAEANMEAVVAYYAGQINGAGTYSAALDNVKTAYTGNSTVSITDSASWTPVGGSATGVRVLTVTVTVGDTKLTTLLTNERTNTADGNANY